MTKIVTLTIGERMAALKILDGFKGTIVGLASVLEDVKKLAITPEDWEVAGRIITKSEGGEQWNWNEDDVKTHKELSLLVETVDYLNKEIKSKSDKNEITIADRSLISLEKKLK